MLDSHIHLWRAADGYDVWIRRKIAGLDHDFTLDALRAAMRSVTSRMAWRTDMVGLLKVEAGG